MDKTEKLIDVVDNMNAAQTRVNRDIDSRLVKLESRKAKSPSKPIGDRVMGAARVAAYSGPRLGLFLIVTLASIAGAALGYESVFEGAELSQPAWVGLFGAVSMVVPLSIATFVTRKRNPVVANKAAKSAGRYDSF